MTRHIPERTAARRASTVRRGLAALVALALLVVGPPAALLTFVGNPVPEYATIGGRLTDEAVHITSSFLLAGFPTAVGTLWTIDSTHADQVTRDFYRRATSADGTGPGTGAGTGAGSGSGTGTAHALHDTVRRLRRHIPDRPHIWAAYVHAGA